jgi:hypothetical protein
MLLTDLRQEKAIEFVKAPNKCDVDVLENFLVSKKVTTWLLAF